MDEKQYKKWVALISFAVGATTGILVSKDKASYAAVIPLAGTWLVYLLRSKVKDVMEDEMIQAYAAKVAKKTMDIFMISLTILGLFFLGFKRGYPELEIAGYTLLYSICYMLLLNAFFHYLYTRNLTGEDGDDKK